MPNAVQTDEGESVARQLNANSFLECSAKDYRNIDEVIYEAVRAIDRGIPAAEEQENDCMSWISCCF